MKNVEDIYTLSPMQQGILFHALYAPNSGVYVEQLVCTLQGNLNTLVFEQTWQQIVARHPILRTAFLWNDLDEPLQVVRKQVDIPWVYYDWQSQSLTKQQQLEIFLETDRNQGFKLNQAPLMRLALIKTDQETYYFVWSHHHLLLDGWCYPLIFEEVFTLYESLSQNKSFHLNSSRPYRDYIAWLQQQDLLKAQAFWRQELEGFSAPNSLVSGKAWDNQYNQKPIYKEQHLCLSSAATNTLKSFAQQHRLTVNTLLQGAWALLLSRYSGDDDVIFGTVVSGRPPDLVGVESMIGLFINTLPLRVKISDNSELVPWLHELQLRQIERLQYSYSPLVNIHSFCDIPADIPLFESILVFENYPIDSLRQMGADSQNNLNNLKITNVCTFEQTNYPLTIVVDCSSELSIRISYDISRFESSFISRMLGHLQTLLVEGIASNLKQRLFELPWLTAAEKYQLLIEWNDTYVEYPDSNKCLHSLFEEQVEKSPDAIAVAFEDQSLTYRQLNQRANQLAHYLQSKGVKPDVLVGICIERSLLMIIGLLAILKAGGAYVPLDPAYPSERLAYMLSDSQVQVLITHSKLVNSLPATNQQVICLDKDWGVIREHCSQNPESSVESSNLAYVIYTSGSTGKPKGTMILHKGVVNYLTWCTKAYQVGLGSGAPVQSSLAFDATVTSLFSPLLVGQKVVLLPEKQEIESLCNVLCSNSNFSLVKLTPAHLELLNHLLPSQSAKEQTRALVIGGETLLGKSLSFWCQHAPGTRLINEYGPTETVVGCCVYEVTDKTSLSSTVLIGRPIANTQLYVLDKFVQPVPIGVWGELHIGGDGLARGYLNRPDLTAEKFIPNPFSNKPGERLYKTGDLVRYLPDGNIEFKGRIDNQVKIRGFRIEVGEIEAVLNQHHQVRESVVVACEDIPGNKHLVAYIIPYEESLNANELSSFLKGKLPNYMIPYVFVFQSNFPLTPNGKIDLRALPAPNMYSRLASNFVSPRNSTEDILACTWAEVLKLEKVSIYDNFFELGGHSLLATQLMSRIRGSFSVDLPLHNLFESPTIAELAKVIDELVEKDTKANSPKIVAISRNNHRMKRSALVEEEFTH